ncbi:lipoprotein insertase outer membrane protein LolB [Lampropedia aestuarii]|uniref:lipoprotein insertase outer membrane protein LolB n=1 Tax=Lampropedia aestuarii TaxID=2562762 RepID=UPI0024682DAD|nr:lipoprotein insertase outer membrane protein LolB [Lampropedia aestuarii]MDH5858766.1 lipoprotein insertase outer membrane protein LolB [Lampropedia aestuarii]
MSLTTEEARPQSFSASFELTGSAQQGELEIYNPLGNIVARLFWSPGLATVHTGSEQRSSASLDELIARVVGTPIPVQALFAWLQGDAQAVVGWQVDLSRYAQGRISAVREQPLPRANLRVVLQSPDA